MTAHRHAHLMLQYAQDAMETDKPWERWELRPMGSKQWHACSGRISFNERCEYRRKPKTLTYTVTIPEPLRKAPEVLAPYFAAQPTPFGFCFGTVWANNAHDNWMLEHGLCFATKEDAIAAAKAMLPIKGEQQ